MREIHVTSLNTYKRCRRLFYFTDTNFLNLEPLEPEQPFYIGRLVHYFLEHYYKSNDEANAWQHFKDYSQKEYSLIPPPILEEGFDASFNFMTLKAKKMLEHYLLWVKGEAIRKRPLNDTEWEWVAFETSFRVPVYSPRLHRTMRDVLAAGRIDGVLLHKPTRKFYIAEHKTATRPADLFNILPLASQATNYLYAAKEIINGDIAGLMYNVITSDVPDTPDILKSGKVSKKSSIKTTGYAYADFLNRYHATWSKDDLNAEYGEFLSELLDTSEGKFFSRRLITKNAHQIDTWCDDMYSITKEIFSKEQTFFKCEDTSKCNWCPFKQPCMQMDEGVTPDFSQFRTKINRDAGDL